MSWKSITREESEFAGLMITWIETVREAYDDPTWLPCYPDWTKSALLERLRNGLEPLDFPPPRGLSCPWYAVVEDPGPHWVERKRPGLWFYDREKGSFNQTTIIEATHVAILQNDYEITRKVDQDEFYVRDCQHYIDGRRSPYEFHIWWDKNYKYSSIQKFPPIGAWVMRNTEFEKENNG